MRAWFSVPIARGIRTGISVNPNSAGRRYFVSATGQKVWRVGSTLMLAGLAIWLFTSRDQEGRLSERPNCSAFASGSAPAENGWG